MASGDMKSPDCTVEVVQAGTAVVIGDIVHLEADGYFDPVTTNDQGGFGVSLDTATNEGDYIRIVKKGYVEVKATNAAIQKGSYIVAGTTGFAVQIGTMDATTIVGTVIGRAVTAFLANGQGTIDIGGF